MNRKDFGLEFVNHIKRNHHRAEEARVSIWAVSQKVYEYLENNNLPTDEKNLSIFADIYLEAFRTGTGKYS